VKHSIIGCGRVAPNHVDAAAHAGVDVKWCCDIDEGALRAFSEKHSISNATVDRSEIFGDSDVTSVSICTDHGSHAAIALDALDAGKHVAIEKPITISVEDARAIVERAAALSRIVTVCFQHRFDPLVVEMKRLVEKERLGTVVSAVGHVQCAKTADYYDGWRGRLRTEGGSALINQGIHTLDLLQWFFGPPEVCGAEMDTLHLGETIETEDTLCALLRFPNGALGSLMCTTGSFVEWDSYIEIVGTRGRIRFTTDFPNEIVACDLAGVGDEARLDEIARSRLAPPPTQTYYGISHRRLLADFFRAISWNEAPGVTARHALDTLKTVRRIYDAAQVRREP